MKHLTSLGRIIINTTAAGNTPGGTNRSTAEYTQTILQHWQHLVYLSLIAITWGEYHSHLSVWESRLKQYPYEFERDEQNMSKYRSDGLQTFVLTPT